MSAFYFFLRKKKSNSLFAWAAAVIILIKIFICGFVDTKHTELKIAFIAMMIIIMKDQGKVEMQRNNYCKTN